jgi:hypothetical protein
MAGHRQIPERPGAALADDPALGHWMLDRFDRIEITSAQSRVRSFVHDPEPLVCSRSRAAFRASFMFLRPCSFISSHCVVITSPLSIGSG